MFLFLKLIQFLKHWETLQYLNQSYSTFHCQKVLIGYFSVFIYHSQHQGIACSVRATALARGQDAECKKEEKIFCDLWIIVTSLRFQATEFLKSNQNSASGVVIWIQWKSSSKVRFLFLYLSDFFYKPDKRIQLFVVLRVKDPKKKRKIKLVGRKKGYFCKSNYRYLCTFNT